MEKEIRLAAFEAARAWSVVAITLSTGAIAFSAIFRDKFVDGSQGIEGLNLLLGAWVIFGISVVAGILFLGKLFRALNLGTVAALDLYSSPIKYTFFLQYISFLVGLACLLVCLVMNLY